MRLARQVYDAWNRRDLEWLLDHSTADSEFRTAQLFPDTDAVYRGHEEFKVFWNTFREAWEAFLIEVERLEPVGDDRVLALLRLRGTGRQGAEVTLEFGNLITVEGRMVRRVANFADWQQALEAAGLSE